MSLRAKKASEVQDSGLDCWRVWSNIEIMGIRAQLLTISLTAIVVFAVAVFFATKPILRKAELGRDDAGAYVSWISEQLATQNQRLGGQLRLLTKTQRLADDVNPDFLFWGVFTHSSSGISVKWTSMQNRQEVSASLLGPWKQAITAKELQAGSLNWKEFEFQGKKYWLLLALGEKLGDVQDILTGAVDQKWMAAVLGKYIDGTHQVSVLGRDEKIYFSNQIDMIGEDGSVLPWIAGWMRGARKATYEYKGSPYSLLRVFALPVPASPFHVLTAHVYRSQVDVTRWKISFVLMAMSVIAFLWGGLGWVINPLYKSLADLKFVTREFPTAENRFFIKNIQTKAFAPIFQNLSRIQMHWFEMKTELEKQSQQLASQPPIEQQVSTEVSTVPNEHLVQEAVVEDLEEKVADMPQDTAFLTTLFDQMMVSLGKIQTVKRNLPETEWDKLAELESHLREIKGQIGTCLKGEFGGSEVFQKSSDQMIDDLLRDESIKANVQEDASMEAAEEEQIDFFVRKPRIRDK